MCLSLFFSQELVKYTPESHPDYSHVVAAQKAMTGVAVLINERKRRMEALGRLRTWQNTLDNWRVWIVHVEEERGEKERMGEKIKGNKHVHFNAKYMYSTCKCINFHRALI